MDSKLNAIVVLPFDDNPQKRYLIFSAPPEGDPFAYTDATFKQPCSPTQIYTFASLLMQHGYHYVDVDPMLVFLPENDERSAADVLKSVRNFLNEEESNDGRGTN